MIKVGISAAAIADLNEAYWFYEAQEAGLGEYFAVHLRADIEGLKVTGGIYRQVYRDTRRRAIIFFVSIGDGADVNLCDESGLERLAQRLPRFAGRVGPKILRPPRLPPPPITKNGPSRRGRELAVRRSTSSQHSPP